MKLWKRNAIVVAIVVFVGAAVYLNWTYGQSEDVDGTPSGKVLGEAALVSGTANGSKDEGKTGNTEDAKNSTGPKESEGNAEGAEGKEDGINEGSDTETGGEAEPSTGYFASARLNRQQARDSALEILQQAAADAMADQAVIDDANASIQQLAANTLSEAQVENLVTAKGYTDCVCYINENSASVVVSATENGLTDADTARISEIVMEETGLTTSQIKIIEAKP